MNWEFTCLCLRNATLCCYKEGTARHTWAAYEGKNVPRKLSEWETGCLIRPSVSCRWISPRRATLPLTWKDGEQRIRPVYSQRPFPSEILTLFLSLHRARERKTNTQFGHELKKKKKRPKHQFISTRVIVNILKILSGLYICLPFPLLRQP